MEQILTLVIDTTLYKKHVHMDAFRLLLERGWNDTPARSRTTAYLLLEGLCAER